MSLAALMPAELEVVRRAMAATFEFFSFDFQARLGLEPEQMATLLAAWPHVTDVSDDSEACLAVNNSLNDLLHGVGISEEECQRLLGVSRVEAYRIYRKWASARGWASTGVR